MRMPVSRSFFRPRQTPMAMLGLSILLVLGSMAGPLDSASAATPTPSPQPTSSGSHAPLTMGSFPTGDYAADAARLPSALSTALQRDVGLTPSQYLADAAAAARAVKVVASLKTAGVHVLGSSIAGTRLTVNVASVSDTAAVSAAGATSVIGAPAKRDYSALSFHTVAGMNTYGGQAYFFQQASQLGTGSGERCSIGFSGYSATTGAPQFVTAGHCATAISGNAFLVTQNAPSSYGGTLTLTNQVLGSTIAGEAQYSGGMDYGIIGESAAGLSAQPSLYTWNGGTGAPLASAPLAITGETAAIAGATLCKSGSTSGWTCGTISAVDQTATVSGQAVNSIVASTCLLPGDSGGGAVIGQNAVGIGSGSNFPDAPCASSSTCTDGSPAPCQSVFFPMVSAAGTYSITGQQGTRWQLAVAVTTPAPSISSPASGATVYPATVMTGTLAGATSGSTVLLYLDGSSIPFTRASASSGSWSIPLAGIPLGSHSYMVAGGIGWSPGSAVSGSFVAAPANAEGSFDSASGVPGGIQISGWSLDLSTTASTYVWVNVDGTGGPMLANQSLPWINALYPGEGANHGFAGRITATPGNHTVCVYGTNSINLGCKTVTVPNNAEGSFDSASGVPGGIQISGWSLDLSTTASTYVWVNVDGTGGPMLANQSLPWINALYPGEGANHGFAGRITATPGNHTVCVYGTNSINLGCKTVTVPNNAEGSFDSASGVPGGIQISGWSLDLSTTASTYVWVNVDGTGGPMLADRSLPWINALFPGEGANHGFAGRITAIPGSHTVCVYGTNSINLGCKTVTVPNNAEGSFDSASGVAGGIQISGWSLDLSTTASTYVWVNVDGTGGPMLANQSLPWINALYPGEGANHGFAGRITATPGNHTVCVYGSNALSLGCKTVTVPAN